MKHEPDFEDDPFGDVVMEGNKIVGGCDYGIVWGNPAPDHVCQPPLERPKMFTPCQHCGRMLEVAPRS